MGLCKISLAFVLLLGLTLADPSLGQDSIEDYLNAHNAAQADAYAKNYANQCIGECNLMHFGVQEYGENLACGSIDLIGTEAMKMWIDEKANYMTTSTTLTLVLMGRAATILKWFGATQFI